METEFTSGMWDTDDLLQAVLAYPDEVYHGSHSLTHLSRDELQESDCNIEDGGRLYMAGVVIVVIVVVVDAWTSYPHKYAWAQYSRRSSQIPL